jgi:membrane-associated phospholipid phosphatase
LRINLKDKRVSIVCHLLLALGVLPFILLYSKSESLLVINGNHSIFLDKVMYHITRLPELALIVFAIVLSLFSERKVFISVLVAMSLSGIGIVIFKHFLFTDFYRPFQWLSSNEIEFHRVDGIRLHSYGSFPSGHTIAAFCSLALVGFISKNGFVQFICFLLACLAAYSRVYVAQHYLMDVYAGALIGFIFAFIPFILFNAKLKTPFWQKPFINLKK